MKLLRPCVYARSELLGLRRFVSGPVLVFVVSVAEAAPAQYTWTKPSAGVVRSSVVLRNSTRITFELAAYLLDSVASGSFVSEMDIRFFLVELAVPYAHTRLLVEHLQYELGAAIDVLRSSWSVKLKQCTLSEEAEVWQFVSATLSLSGRRGLRVTPCYPEVPCGHFVHGMRMVSQADRDCG